ncbi:helix-turn-helix domain-containing protein [Microbacterium sp. ISL-59]|nr:helix-turn-helix domain-containing protein [Microbacterium sp. ISL-59]
MNSATVYLTPEQVCELIPGMTKPTLAQLRFKGTGPRYFKPTPRVVLYAHDDIEEWVRSSVRTSTANE